jgi:hypothetical protein
MEPRPRPALAAGLIKITGKRVQPWQSAPTEFKDDDPS